MIAPSPKPSRLHSDYAELKALKLGPVFLESSYLGDCKLAGNLVPDRPSNMNIAAFCFCLLPYTFLPRRHRRNYYCVYLQEHLSNLKSHYQIGFISVLSLFVSRAVASRLSLSFSLPLKSLLVFYLLQTVFRTMDFYHWSESGRENMMRKVKFHTDADFSTQRRPKFYWVGGSPPCDGDMVVGRGMAGIWGTAMRNIMPPMMMPNPRS